jgi:bacillithiol biosynthesis deacetylase BshB1
MKPNSTSVEILAFGAHPDDVEFGCGGLLAKTVAAGGTCCIVDMSEAELSTNGTVEERYREAEKAREILGVQTRINLQIPNNKFYNSDAIQDKLVRTIRTYQPRMIVIPWHYDRHPDHENASRLIREAVFTAGLEKYVTDGLSKHRPLHFYYYGMWGEFEPSFILDISDVWEKKHNALFEAYQSQFSSGGLKTIDTDERTKKLVEARARSLGFAIGATFGEAYRRVYNTIGVTDPFALLPNLY